MTNLRQAAQQAAGAVDAYIGAQLTVGQRYTNEGQGLLDAHAALRAALAEPEQEPVATKQMLRWVEYLKRLSDDGQHMSIPGLSSGACWELAIELDQFIKNTAPTPRKPLTDEEIAAIASTPCAVVGSYVHTFARAIERAHGIGEQT